MDMESVKNTFGELLTSLQRLRDAEAEIESLKGTVRVINDRVQSLIAENDNLKHELYSVVAERDVARNDSVAKQSEIERLKDVLFQRDETINYTNGVLTSTQNALNEMTSDRDRGLSRERDHEDRAKTLEDQIYHLTSTLDQTRSELAQRVAQLNDMEREMLHWQARFNAVNSVLESLKEALANVPAVVTPVAA
jgi:chromosome segregation ATPase